MDKRRKIVLITAVILAIIAGLSFNTYSNNLDDRVNIVVAVRNIDSNTVIEPDMVELRKIHPENVVEGSYKKIEEVVGKATEHLIVKGEQIVNYRLTDEVVEVKNTIAEKLGDGKIALSITTSVTRAVGGEVHPGDRVKIYAVDGLNTIELLHDVPIIDILDAGGDKYSKEDKERGELAIVLLELDEEQIGYIAPYALSNNTIIGLPGKD